MRLPVDKGLLIGRRDNKLPEDDRLPPGKNFSSLYYAGETLAICLRNWMAYSYREKFIESWVVIAIFSGGRVCQSFSYRFLRNTACKVNKAYFWTQCIRIPAYLLKIQLYLSPESCKKLSLLIYDVTNYNPSRGSNFLISPYDPYVSCNPAAVFFVHVLMQYVWIDHSWTIEPLFAPFTFVLDRFWKEKVITGN